MRQGRSQRGLALAALQARIAQRRRQPRSLAGRQAPPVLGVLHIPATVAAAESHIQTCGTQRGKAALWT